MYKTLTPNSKSGIRWFFLLSLFCLKASFVFALSGNVSGILDMTPSAYIVTSNITVPQGQTLVINPGVVLKFMPGISLTVLGTLQANGVPVSPVVFTSLQDDEFGGDSNNDGSATIPTHGDWDRIVVGNGTGIGSLQGSNLIVRYGENAIDVNNAILDISMSTVSNSSVAGITLNTFSTGSINFSQIMFNPTGILANQSIGSIHQSVISGNSGFGIYNQTPEIIFDASNNFWGHVTGPNPLGSGDKVSSGVNIFPFQSVPPDFSQTLPKVSFVTLSGPAKAGILPKNGILDLAHSGSLAFTLDFDRLMNISKLPVVTLGQFYPFDSFTVPGSWQDAQTWTGSFSISNSMANGLYVLSVSQAVGENSQVMLPQNVVAFIVDTVTAPGAPLLENAVSLPGGAIKISWSAGPGTASSTYQVYRSTRGTDLLPATTASAALRIVSHVNLSSYTDVPPQDGLYFYAVTALDNSFNESLLSSTTSAASDRTPPTAIVVVSSPGVIGPGDITVTLTVSETLLAAPTLYFTPQGSTSQILNLISIASNVWQTLITISSSTPAGMTSFSFQGMDLSGNSVGRFLKVHS